MLINGFTVCAQIINFPILVWLLKRFLYKPILAAMDAREKQVEGNIQEAQQKKIEAEQEGAHFREQLEDFERRKADNLKQAEAEANGYRRERLEEARTEVEAQRIRWQEALRQEQQERDRGLARRVQGEVFAIARHVLQGFAGQTLEERMAELWQERLRALDPEEKRLLAASLQGAQHPIRLRSAFELPPPARERLTQAIQRELGTQVAVAFETAPDLIGGIELCTEERKLTWTIAASLADLEKSAAELLEKEGNVSDNVSEKEGSAGEDRAELSLAPVGPHV